MRNPSLTRSSLNWGRRRGSPCRLSRHLFYTSHTLAVQELKDKLEPREEAKRLSMADRVDRLERLKQTLTGVTIDTWLEPSHSLVDKAVAFAEEQCLGPLELSRCTSREAEMRSEKRDAETFRLEKINIKVTKPRPMLSAETSTDLHVRTCMQRRALAFHMAGMLFSRHLFPRWGILLQIYTAQKSLQALSVLRSWLWRTSIHAGRPLWWPSKPRGRPASSRWWGF